MKAILFWCVWGVIRFSPLDQVTSINPRYAKVHILYVGSTPLKDRFRGTIRYERNISIKPFILYSSAASLKTESCLAFACAEKKMCALQKRTRFVSFPSGRHQSDLSLAAFERKINYFSCCRWKRIKALDLVILSWQKWYPSSDVCSLRTLTTRTSVCGIVVAVVQIEILLLMFNHNARFPWVTFNLTTC